MTNSYKISKDDIKNRIYFIARMSQGIKSGTMQGALTSKSDFIGGIFDRFINTLSDTLVFNKIILKNDAFKKFKNIEVIEDFYYYKPTQNGAGIAPDIFGIMANDKVYPFVEFNDTWNPISKMPQIEVKTFKAKDQMVSLRNQNYDNKILVFVDLNLRIDYLIPFLDEKYLNSSISKKIQMDDSIFIKKDTKHLISKVTPIDYTNKDIGELKLISIFHAKDFMDVATLCNAGESVCRVKEVLMRKTNIKNNVLHDKLSDFCKKSSKLNSLFEFNDKWYQKLKINKNTKCLDFSSDNINDIEICQYNKGSIVITSSNKDCTFNDHRIEKGKQYTIKLDTLDRSGSKGSEYFMQKSCAYKIKSSEKSLINDFLKIIK